MDKEFYSFDQLADRLRLIGEQLVPYNFPKGPENIDDILSMYKMANVCVDGYDVFIYFNKADFGNYFIETIQIFGKHTHFLPFIISWKIANRILGSHKLFLVEYYKNNRKIYAWSVSLDKKGRPIDFKKEKAKICMFEGQPYKQLDSSSIKI